MKKIKISAIIAIYNVEEYIVEALDSLLEQEVENIDLEVLVVDDGSTDGTPKILKEYTSKYDNVKVINVDRVGLGKARNVAIDASTGDYLIFMDGDDIIYPNAYYALLESALKNDADIVVGNVSRFDSTRDFFLSGLHKKIFSDDLEGTHILENKQLMYDTTAWNKLFKASFFKENNLRFLEGMLYEDIPCMMKAHLLSKQTNIILDYVYKWRLRDNTKNRSITQNRHDKQNLLDRVKSVDIFTDVVNELEVTNEVFLREKEFKELTIDYKLYFDMLPEVDMGYFELFAELLKKYVDNMKTDVFEKEIPTELRLMYQLVMNKEYDKFMVFKSNILEFRQMKTIQNGVKVTKDMTGTAIEKVLDNPVVDMNSDIKPFSKVKKARWANGILFIEGFAYLRYLNTNKNYEIKAYLVNRDESKMIPLETEIFKDKSVTQMYGGGKNEHLVKRHVNYDYASYKLEIDTNKTDIFELLNEACYIKLVLNNSGVEDETYVMNPTRGLSARVSDYLYKDRGYRVFYNKQWRLEITHFPIIVENMDPKIENNQLVITGEMKQDFSSAYFEYANDNIRIKNHTFNKLENNQFELIFDLSKMLDVDYDSNFYLYLVKDGKQTMGWLEDTFISKVDEWNGKEIRFTRTYNKFLKINLNPTKHPKLADIKILPINKKEQQIEFKINQFVESTSDISKVLVRGIRKSDGKIVEIEPTETKLTKNNLEASYLVKIDIKTLHLFGNSQWDLKQVCESSSQIYTNEILYEITEEIPALNVLFSVDKNNFVVSSNRDGVVGISSTLQKSYFEDGPRRTKLLTDYLYPLMRKLPQKKNYVMFESYWGKSFSCNPKAIYEELQEEYPNLKCIWSFNNPYTEVSGNAIRVKRNSWQYFYYLARSKYFINNVNWQNEYVKRKNSVEVQTLHGTFLKTMGLDVANEVDTPQKLESFRLRHGRWDYLVSPSSFMTKISRRVFEFNGEMLEYGFPRNDMLVNVDKEKDNIDELKEKLGIPKDKKVILYAPTFRNTRNFNLELDIERMRAKLSDEYVLLVRLHYFVSKSLDLESVSDFAINVCDYPDTQDLLLISDVLISDYSSIMFDYANLNKPIILFTYDLEYYRDILRGMYTDLEKEAPGRLCRTSEEVIESLMDIKEYEKKYTNRMSAFKQKFNEFETGEASKLIAEKLFGKPNK